MNTLLDRIYENNANIKADLERLIERHTYFDEKQPSIEILTVLLDDAAMQENVIAGELTDEARELTDGNDRRLRNIKVAIDSALELLESINCPVKDTVKLKQVIKNLTNLSENIEE